MDSTATATAPPESGGPRHGPGSIGPFFAVMSVIIVLTVMACIAGRVCAAQAEGPDTWYDCVAWAHRQGRRRIIREAKAAVTAELDAKVSKGDRVAALSVPQP